MVARLALGALVFGSLSGLVNAAPAVSAPTPAKVTLGMHKLEGGAKPRNRARLSRASSKGSRATSSSEPLSDYYLGTDLQ